MDLLEKCKRVSKFGEMKSNYIPDLDNNSKLQLKEEIISSAGPSYLAIDERTKFRFEDNCKEIYYISDIHLDEHIVKYCKSEKDISKYIEKVVDNLIDSLNEKKYGDRIILFLGDVASSFEIAELFYSLFMSKLYEKGVWGPREGVTIPFGITNYVYAILGNHEFWSFNNKESCYKAYEKLFNDLGIIFLNNSIEYLGRKRTVLDNKGWYSDCKTKEDVEKQMKSVERHIHNIIIVGGTGFAGNGKVFTADNGLYRNALNREEEKLETRKWLQTYKEALKLAFENKCNLVVATHNPIDDWYSKKELLQGTYLYGHTHKIYRRLDEKRDSFVFADNQIGYCRKDIKFKRLNVFNRVNPFVNYKDGYYEVSTKQYVMFNDYILEDIQGTTFIDKYLESGLGKFYMIKQKDYYGFFIVKKDNSVLICAGGRPKKIRAKSSIQDIYRDFSRMTDLFVNLFSPYRKYQEQLALEIQKIGGDGGIHGLIIDIDFNNHIMVNTDGSITFYFSYIPGELYPYNSLYNLLKCEHNKENLMLKDMLDKYNTLVKVSNGLVLTNTSNMQGFEEGKKYRIDMKNSQYAISNRYNQVQRIFSKNVLRDWNDELLYSQNGNVLGLLKMN